LEPWEKFGRDKTTPADIGFSIIGWVELGGPGVAVIPALRVDETMPVFSMMVKAAHTPLVGDIGGFMAFKALLFFDFSHLQRRGGLIGPGHVVIGCLEIILTPFIA
jgi:hypothetical protein